MHCSVGIRFGLGVAIASLIAVSPCATAGAIFDDTDGINNAGGGYQIGQYSPSCYPCNYVDAAAFTVPLGQNFFLSQIGILVSTGSANNGMTFGLYSTGAGNVPGGLLQSWTSGVTSSVELLNLTASTPVLLVSGQQYWVVAGMSDPNATGVWWITPNIAPPASILQGIASASYNGGAFNAGALTTSGFEAFYVDGMPTPEPSSFVLLGAGLLVVVMRTMR